MKICVAICCENYEKRLCWMLSSILQQENPPEIVVDVAYLDRKFGKNIRTVNVLTMFEKAGLNIKRTHYYRNTKEFERRGLVRNRQLAETDADWILFADCDMSYPPDFFNKLEELLSNDFKDSSDCLHSARFSTLLKETNKVVDNLKYPCIVPIAHKQLNKLPGKTMKDIGAGYCQIANVARIKESDCPYYVPDDFNRDAAFLSDKNYKSYTPKSDMSFRRRLGAKKIPLPLQIHIQHERDSEGHLTHQR